MLSGDPRDPAVGERVRRAVDLQLRRAGVEAQDSDDVRTEVVLALLCAAAGELPLPLELVCARASAIARHKAIDHGRRRARAPLAFGDCSARAGCGRARPGSLADGLDEVTAAAHRRRVRADLVLALGRLDAPQRAAIAAHAEGGAARAAGLPRSTYYRVLAHAQARLRSDLRGRLDRRRRARRRRRSAHARCSSMSRPCTAPLLPRRQPSRSLLPSCWACTTSTPTALPAPVPVVAVASSGGRVAAAPPRGREGAPAAPAPRQRATAAAPPPVGAPARAAAAASTSASCSCTYDPSAYDC